MSLLLYIFPPDDIIKLNFLGNYATFFPFSDSNIQQNQNIFIQGGNDMKCDAKTFAQMYETVYKDLYRFALCLMKNQQEAEDAVSETVLSAYENIRKLRREEAFRSWIFTILSNVCRKKLKKSAEDAKRLKPESFFEETGECAADEKDYGLSVDVRNAFFILSEEEQIIVGLSVFGGYRSGEIADMLRLNRNTVRSKRSRALAKMECVLR